MFVKGISYKDFGIWIMRCTNKSSHIYGRYKFVLWWNAQIVRVSMSSWSSAEYAAETAYICIDNWAGANLNILTGGKSQ